MHSFDEVKEVAAGYAAAADFINGTAPTCTGLAVHFSHTAHVTFKNQPQVNGFDYLSRFL